VPSLSFVNGTFNALYEASTHCCPEELKTASKINRSILSSGSMDKLVLSDYIIPSDSSSSSSKISAKPAPAMRTVTTSSVASDVLPAVTSSHKKITSSKSTATKKKIPVRKGSVKRFKKSSNKLESR